MTIQLCDIGLADGILSLFALHFYDRLNKAKTTLVTRCSPIQNMIPIFATIASGELKDAQKAKQPNCVLIWKSPALPLALRRER
jgi:hypothetical protein